MKIELSGMTGDRGAGLFVASLILTMVFALSIQAAPPGMLEARPTIVLLSMVHYGSKVMCPQAERLVVEELYLMDFNVISQPSLAADEREFTHELRDVALRSNASAVVRIYKADDRNWVLSLLTREGANRKINLYDTEIDVLPNDDTAETTAFKVVEALQARLIDSRIAAQNGTDDSQFAKARGQRDQPAVEIPVEEKPATSRRRWRLFSSFTGEFSPGGTGVIGGPTLGGRWLFLPRWSLGLDVALGLIGKDLTNSQFSSAFGFLLARARAAYEITLGRTVSARVGINIGPAYIWARGIDGDETVITRSDNTVMLYLGGGFEVCWAATDHVWFPVYLNIGALPQGAIVEFEGEEVAVFGLPIVEFGIGVMFVL